MSRGQGQTKRTSRRTYHEDDDEDEEEEEEDQGMQRPRGRNVQQQQQQRTGGNRGSSMELDSQEDRRARGSGGSGSVRGARGGRRQEQGRGQRQQEQGRGTRQQPGSCDEYGFPLKVTAQQQLDRKECQQSAAGRAGDWAFMEAAISGGKLVLPRKGKLKKMIRHGVPSAWRPRIWMAVSGAAEHQASNHAGYFQESYKSGTKSPSFKQIKLDLPRTYPGHPWVQSEEAQLMLRHVLAAFAAHNTTVGYCQGLNCVAAFLLLCTDKDEESSFWLLVTLVDHLLYPNIYASSLLGCHVEMRTLGSLIESKLPRLHAHFTNLQCEPPVYCTDWFLCLFCISLPSESAARVLDALFNEGPKILFRVALALLQLLEPFLLEQDNAGDVLMTIKEATAAMHNHDKLMKVAFDNIGGFPIKKIRELRSIHQVDVERMVREREARIREEQNRKALKARREAAEKRRDEEAEARMDAEIGSDRWLPQLDNVFNMAKRMVKGAPGGGAASGSAPVSGSSSQAMNPVSKQQPAAEQSDEDEEVDERDVQEREDARRRMENREKLEAMRRRREAKQAAGTWTEEDEEHFFELDTFPEYMAVSAAAALKGGAMQIGKGLGFVGNKMYETAKMIGDAAVAQLPTSNDRPNAQGSGNGSGRAGAPASKQRSYQEEESEGEEDGEEDHTANQKSAAGSRGQYQQPRGGQVRPQSRGQVQQQVARPEQRSKTASAGAKRAPPR